MLLGIRTFLRPSNLIILGLLMSFSACTSQSSSITTSPQPMPADTVIEMGAAGTPRLVRATDLATDLEEVAAYKDARQKGDYGEMARFFLAHRADLFKLDNPKGDLRLLDAAQDGLGHHHAKFQQVVDGIPVWLKTLSVHFGPQDRLYRVDGDYLPTPMEVDTQPVLNEAGVRTKALQGIAGSGAGWKVEASELVIYAAEAAAPRLAYRLTVAKGFTGREDRIVAADTGQVLKRISRINN